MASKTRLLELVKAFRWREVADALAESPELLETRDQRGRNWLHICCGVSVKNRKQRAADSIKTAEVLLKAGLKINQEAFSEGTWKATPLWYAIARGENLELAEYLLKQGSTPHHSLFAASWNNDLPAIRMLIRYGADVNELAENETPFLGAVKYSRFGPAEELLKLGADPNFRDRHGMTALHYMLKKGSDKNHFHMLIAHRARGDIPDQRGATAAEIMRRKKDPDFRKLADLLLQ